MPKFGYKQYVALIYTVALFLDRLDLTIVNITLPTIARAFKISIVKTDWISLAFLIAMAISIPISGWLGEKFGLKKIFILSLFLFGMGSTLCSVAPNIYFLIIFRFIQGIGGGMLIPIGMTFIYLLYERSEYASITSYIFIPTLIAPAIAPFLGGVLLTVIGWRYVFLFSGPICLCLAFMSVVILKEFDKSKPKPFDWGGFILISILLVDVFIGFSKIGRDGLSFSSICYFIAAFPLLALLVYREKTTLHPIIKFEYFKNRVFTKINLIQICFQSCHFGAIFLIGMYLQLGAGFSAMLTGLIMGMQALGAMTTSRLSVRLFSTISPRFPIIIGLLGIAIISPSVLIIRGQEFLSFGLILFFIRGVFSGLCGTPIQTLSVIGFKKGDVGTVNAMFNICRQISISLGVAISSLLISFGLKNSHWETGQFMNRHQALMIFHSSFIAISVLAILGIIVAIYID